MSYPNGDQTYDILVISPDALPLSYRRLVGAKTIKQGSCDKRPACCQDCEYAPYQHFSPNSMQEVCHMNLV